MESSYPPFEVLKECLALRGSTLYWKERPLYHFKSARGMNIFNGRYSKSEAGTLLGPKNLYRIIWITHCGVRYQVLAHVASWAIFHGNYPDGFIDHKDGNGLNNDPENLILATHSENMHNKRMYKTNSSGCVGVRWYSRYSKWVATGTHNKEKKTIGYFSEFSDAVAARKEWEAGKGFSQRHGK